jgi:hypothetical protein
MGAEYRQTLDSGSRVVIDVDFETKGPEVIKYAIVLLAKVGGTTETIRVYDSAHGYNEMHRHGRDSGKQTGARFHSGTLGEGMRAALADLESGHRKMIEGWEEK